MWIPTTDPPIGTRIHLVTTFQVASSFVTTAQIHPSKQELVPQTVNISVSPGATTTGTVI